MPGLVLDCSIIAAWLLHGEGDDAIGRILARVTENGALVPDVWRIDVLNVLLTAERRKRITSADRVRGLAIIGQLPIDVDAETADRAWAEIATLAARFRLTAHAAAYLDLAHRTGLPLATLDEDLRAAAAKLGVTLMAG